MKLAFDHGVFALQSYGGISRYFFELATRIPCTAHDEISIIAPVHINAYLESDRISQKVVGWRLPFQFRGRTRVVSLANRIVAPIVWARKKVDILHETYYSQSPTGNGRRRVVTVYDMIHELFPAEFPGVQRVIEAKRAAVSRADHVICISENTRQDLLRIMDVDERKVSVTHLGYELASCAVPERLPLPRPFLLYVGIRAGYKNFAGLLRAYAQSRELRDCFDLVAFGGGNFRPDELSELERFGLSGLVRHVAGDDQLLARHYATATAFVYPSLYEGFGIPPLEAMSYGCPVAASDRSSIPEVAGDAASYFNPEDPDSIRSTLESLAGNRELAEHFRARGTGRAALFSWDRCATETLRVYKDLVG